MKYRYVAKSQTGQTVKGELETGNERAAAAMLREKGLMLVKLVGSFDLGSVLNVGALFRHVGVTEMANFTRQLSTMVTAGLPLTDALNLLRVQSTPGLSGVVNTLLADVQGGMALSSAMEKHAKVFTKVYVALIRAGEKAGIMEKVMMRLAENLEKTREFKSKVVGAMIYPIIILIGMVIVTAIMMIYVIPKLSALYDDFGAELPWATKVVIGLSDFSVNYWWAIGVTLALVTFGVRAYLMSEKGRWQWDSLMYKIPVMGPLSRQVMLTELTRTLSLLIGAGVSVVEALNIVADATGNVVVQKSVQRIAKQVEKGFPVAISFAESEIFPPLVGQMAAVGEETGKLDDVMIKLSAYFETESGEKIKGLTTAIEPLILMLLAVGVGFLMYAIIIPIYQLTNEI